MLNHDGAEHEELYWNSQNSGRECYKDCDMRINYRSLPDQSINSIKTEGEYVGVDKKEVDNNNYISL